MHSLDVKQATDYVLVLSDILRMAQPLSAYDRNCYGVRIEEPSVKTKLTSEMGFKGQHLAGVARCGLEMHLHYGPTLSAPSAELTIRSFVV